MHEEFWRKKPWTTLGPRLSMNGAETAHLRASRRSKTRVIHVVQTANDGYAAMQVTSEAPDTINLTDISLVLTF